MTFAPNDRNEQELVARAKGGDFRAFEDIVSQYEGRVFGLAMRLVKQREDAEDITQRTFLSVVEHLPDYREDGSLAAWILRIATNFAFKTLRKRRGVDFVPARTDDQAEDYASLPYPEFIATWSRSPEILAADRETRQLIGVALDHLPETLRATFLLRDVEGLSTEEAAKALGITPGAVKVRLLRARLQLREQLTRLFGDPFQTQDRHTHSDEDSAS